MWAIIFLHKFFQNFILEGSFSKQKNAWRFLIFSVNLDYIFLYIFFLWRLIR